MALVGEPGAGPGDGVDDPEAQLNEWLGELSALTAGLQASNDPLKPLEIVTPRIDTYRFSMANLEDTQDADLDAILGELCALDSECDDEISRVSGATKESAGGNTQRCGGKLNPNGTMARTDSPDNDSAFSDTVSMMSSESSASSNISAKCKNLKLNLQLNQKDTNGQQKADKIKLALERMREASVKKLFIKAFSSDGSSKSLLVDEKMTCGMVTRLLADKNHVTMEPKWSILENIPDLQMERLYEDHEMLVDNVMLWTRDSKNRIVFAEKREKIELFQKPEKYLLTEDDRGWSSEHDEHSRNVIIEEFFGQCSSLPSLSGHPVPPLEGPIYLKSDSKKGWKKYHFVLRSSGLYYSPKDKAKTLKELTCLATFESTDVYVGINWKKKYKSPTDYCFAIKHPRLQQPKSVKYIKFLCVDDQLTLDRWLTAMRIAKHGRQLLDNYRNLVDDLTHEDLESLAQARSCSVSSIPIKTNGAAAVAINSPVQSTASNISVANSDVSSGRHSRASSSSSSGCMSDGGTASESTFDCEFPMGTIKRKPSMKPNIPLTWMTRQLKEMAEKNQDEFGESEEGEDGAGDSGTLTRRPRQQREEDSTLKRHHSLDVADSTFITTNNTAAKPASVQSTYNHYDTVIKRDSSFRSSVDKNSSIYGYSNIYESTRPIDKVSSGNIEDLPLPPPPEIASAIPETMFSSTLSLDSLPPPPPPVEHPMDDLMGSQLSLPPPPPEYALEVNQGHAHDIVYESAAQAFDTTTTNVLPPTISVGTRNSLTTQAIPRQPSLDSISSGTSRTSILSDKTVKGQTAAYGACVVEMQTKKVNIGSPTLQKKPNLDVNRVDKPAIKKHVNFADELTTCIDGVSTKKTKKISFCLPKREEPLPPPSPRKPIPPKRNESTRLSSSPKKLNESNSNPPMEFLKDLQRVMRKKWQVAQKCKLEPATTPHEVLGFREFPLPDYKESSVSMWVHEHYGLKGEDPFYENVYELDQQMPKRENPPKPVKKKPPPAPPKRSDSTHLTHAPPNFQ